MLKIIAKITGYIYAVLTVILTLTGDIYVVLTVIVIITVDYCSVNSYGENNGDIYMYTNSHCDEIYM